VPGGGQEQDRLVRFLEGRGVLVRTLPHLSCIRVSVHYLTLERDIENLMDEIRRFPAAD
jgi:L-cysteine/cystine lyase